MATALDDLVEALKREVSIPGRFEVDYPSVTNNDIVGLLGDGFSEAQLNGLFQRSSLDVDAGEITPDLSQAGALVVVLFAALRMTRQSLSASSASVSYKAGPVSMQEQKYSNVLTTVMRSLQDRLDRILRQAGSGSVLPFVLDGYHARGAAASYGALAANELPGSIFGVHLG